LDQPAFVRGVTVDAVSDGSIRRFRGQYLIGCDGAHSLVRNTLDLPLVGKTYQTRVLIADVSFSQPMPLPTPRIALKVVGTVDQKEVDDAARSKQGVSARVRMLAGDVPFQLLWSSTFQIHSRVVQHLRVQRVFLAGGRLAARGLLAVEAVTDGDEGGIAIEFEFDGAACALSRVFLRHDGPPLRIISG
jgi:hypothetical protein